MPYFLSEFIKLNSGIELIIDVTNKARFIESLELNEVDFALVSVFPKKLKVKNIELMQNSLYFIGSSELNFKKTK